MHSFAVDILRLLMTNVTPSADRDNKIILRLIARARIPPEAHAGSSQSSCATVSACSPQRPTGSGFQTQIELKLLRHLETSYRVLHVDCWPQDRILDRNRSAPHRKGALRSLYRSVRRRCLVSVREALKRKAAWALCATGAATLSRRLNRGRLAILMYHGIEAAPLSPSCWHVLDAKTLKQQLTYVRKHFVVLPLEEALERLYAGTLPENAATLTFDDGTRNLLTHAAPVLRDLDLPAAVFLATGPMGTDEVLWPDRLWLTLAGAEADEVDLTSFGLGNRPLTDTAHRGAVYAALVERFKDLPDAERIARLDQLVSELPGTSPCTAGPFKLLSWDEARDLADDGRITLYPHTVTHPILSRCDDAKVDEEISESYDALRREIGSNPKVFAYPNGRVQDFDERAQSTLRRIGVRWALATTKGLADQNSDRLALPRIPVGDDLTFAGFRLMISGVGS